MQKKKNKTGKVYVLVPKRSNLKARMRTEDSYFLDFIKILLEIDPTKRVSASEALQHPFITQAQY